MRNQQHPRGNIGCNIRMKVVVGLGLILAIWGADGGLATEAGTIARTGSLADSPKPIRTVTLSEPALQEIRSFPGYLKARYDVQLSFRVSGPLIELPALKGTVVKEGDLLARMDPRDFESTIATTKGMLDNLTEILRSLEVGRPEDIASAEAAVAAAKATSDTDKINLQRSQNLYAEKVIPKIDLDEAAAQANRSASALEEANQALQKLKLGARPEDIKAAQANVDAMAAKYKSAQDALRDTQLRAPFTGIISDRYVENHQFVNATQTVVSMQDLTTFEVVINVPEQMLILSPKATILGSIEATARFDVIPGKDFPLTFKEFSTRADVQAQTFAATFYLSPEDTKYTFLPGMTVTVDVKHTLSDPSLRSSFVLPPEAVQTDNSGKHYAWRLNKTDRDGVFKTEKVPVTLGQFSHSGMLVTSGVKSGEKYAATGAAYLQDGMLVTELAWEGK